MAKIWVVEDDDVVAELVADLLEVNGYEVTKYPYGGPVLENLKAGMAPDLIVLDLKMPPPDGNDVLEVLKNFVGFPVIVLTAYENFLRPHLQNIPYGIVGKPFKLEHLLGTVRNALAVKQVKQKMITNGGRS